jgi:osmotically-inducible protein OsmY
MYNPGHFGGGYAGSPELVEHYAVPGRYAGVGPKGYTRSDDRIREDVSEQLWADPWIDASEMSVAVADGEVTLEGTVNDRASKRLAEDVAETCPGVKDVHNRLKIAGNATGVETVNPRDSGSASLRRRP